MPTKKERKNARRHERKAKAKRDQRRASANKAKYVAQPYQEKFLVPIPKEPKFPKEPKDLLNPKLVWDDAIFEEEAEALPFPPPIEPVAEQGLPMPDAIQIEFEAKPKAVKKAEGSDLDHEVLAVQVLVEGGLAKSGGSRKTLPLARDESVIQQVRDGKVDDMIPVMGEFMASRLKYFCDSVDLDHPDIQDIIRDGFQADSEFNGTLREVMTFTTLPTGKDMPRVLGLLRESFTKAKSMKDVRVAIYKPHARTLRTHESRDEARSKKTVKEVAVKDWLEKARDWNDHPNGFSSFARFNESHAEEIKTNEVRSAKMADSGLTALAASFKKRNDIIAAFIGEQYAGFIKIKMIDAAIILGKVHGAIFREDYRSISYTRKSFVKSPFWLEPETVYPAPVMNDKLEVAKDEAGQPLNLRKITVQACMLPDIFTFKPRAYPIHEFKVEKPKHVQESLAAVEAHPDMGGKAMFDQFWVIVPGFALAPEMHEYSMFSGKVWVIAKPDKTAEIYQSAADAEKALDFRLTAEGCLRPVILGEKDGKCYFLTYWN